MTCTCGQVMSIDADTREEAVSKMKEMMTQEALDEHLRTYHKVDEPISQQLSNLMQ